MRRVRTEAEIVDRMSTGSSNDDKAVIPTITYRNANAMIEWLCDTFGFRRHLIVNGDHGEIKHAELAFGDSMIMVVSLEHSPFETLVVHPDQIDGAETQTCYLIVSDVEAHYRRAKAKNADIIFGVRVENSGGLGYACRDPEGHLWMFGTYDPRQQLMSRPTSFRAAPGRERLSKGNALLSLVLSGLLLASTATALWSYSEMRRQTLLLDRITGTTGASPARIDHSEQGGAGGQEAELKARSLAAKLIEVQAAKEKVEQTVHDLAAQLARERSGRDSALQSGQEAHELLVQEVKAKEALSRAVQQANDQLGRERAAKEAAERVAKDAVDQIRLAKLAADRGAKDATDRCEQERATRSVAERSVVDVRDQLARERNARAVAELAANELRNQLASVGPEPRERIAELRYQVEMERRANGAAERAVKDVKVQLAQEKYSRDAAERALRQTEQKIAVNQVPSCWSCPSAALCERH